MSEMDEWKKTESVAVGGILAGIAAIGAVFRFFNRNKDKEQVVATMGKYKLTKETKENKGNKDK